MDRRAVRHRLGLAKHRLLDDMAYRGRMRQALRFRQSARDLIQQLPPITRTQGTPVEVHMLCGAKQFDMGVAASWSIMRFLPGATLFLHSDGTLTEGHLASWRRIIEAVEFIPKEPADEMVSRALGADYPNLHHWRTTNWAAYQLTDYSLFGTTRTVISCDSDVLCLRDPVYLKRHIAAGGMRWNEDIRTCYSAPTDLLRSITGLAIPERLNAGLAIFPRLTDADFRVCDEAIERLRAVPGFDVDHPYSSQTYLAFIAATQRGSGPLPTEYSVYAGRTRSTSVTRHFVGIPSIRSRYFLEGWPVLFQQAGLS